MLNRIYLIGGGLLVASYFGGSYIGMEPLRSRIDKVPVTKVYRAARTGAYYGGRSSGGYRSSGGGWSFGK